jgi:hypothetical protein
MSEGRGFKRPRPALGCSAIQEEEEEEEEEGTRALRKFRNENFHDVLFSPCIIGVIKHG